MWVILLPLQRVVSYPKGNQNHPEINPCLKQVVGPSMDLLPRRYDPIYTYLGNPMTFHEGLCVTVYDVCVCGVNVKQT